MMSGYYYHMHNNPNWHFYGPPRPHYFQGTESGTNPTTVPAGKVGPTVTAENTQQNSSREDKMVMYNTSIKVLNSTNKKDFTVYTLRGLSAEDFLTPDTLREEVFSIKMDFCIGYFKRNVINNDQDLKEDCETLEKVGKLTLWCIGIENCDSKKGRSSTESVSEYQQFEKKECDHTKE